MSAPHPCPRRLRSATTDVPVLTFQTETDLLTLGYLPARQPDSKHFRLWEMAGASHADSYTGQFGFNDVGDGKAELSMLDPTKASGGPLNCSTPINSSPAFAVLSAAVSNLNRWVQQRDPAPLCPAPRRGRRRNPRSRQPGQRGRRSPLAVPRRPGRDPDRAGQLGRLVLPALRHHDTVRRADAHAPLPHPRPVRAGVRPCRAAGPAQRLDAADRGEALHRRRPPARDAAGRLIAGQSSVGRRRSPVRIGSSFQSG